jgi:hypothetical protein
MTVAVKVAAFFEQLTERRTRFAHFHASLAEDLRTATQPGELGE